VGCLFVDSADLLRLILSDATRTRSLPERLVNPSSPHSLSREEDSNEHLAMEHMYQVGSIGRRIHMCIPTEKLLLERGSPCDFKRRSAKSRMPDTTALDVTFMRAIVRSRDRLLVLVTFWETIKRLELLIMIQKRRERNDLRPREIEYTRFDARREEEGEDNRRDDRVK